MNFKFEKLEPERGVEKKTHRFFPDVVTIETDSGLPYCWYVTLFGDKDGKKPKPA